MEEEIFKNFSLLTNEGSKEVRDPKEEVLELLRKKSDNNSDNKESLKEKIEALKESMICLIREKKENDGA